MKKLLGLFLVFSETACLLTVIYKTARPKKQPDGWLIIKLKLCPPWSIGPSPSIKFIDKFWHLASDTSNLYQI